jgi:hypothetical protein
MGRAAFLAFIAVVFLTGGYFVLDDFRVLASGSLPSATGVYEALICLVSAVALFMDFRGNQGDGHELVD